MRRKPKWIRGKALETVLALNAMQEGDAVLVAGVDDTRWKRARVTTVINKHGYTAIVCPCRRACKLPIPVTSATLVGWRRVVDK